MAGVKKDDRESEILKQCRKRVNEALAADQHNRQAALNDLKMKVGEDHWIDGRTDFEKQRQDDGRPCLVFNRLPTFSSQVIGDLRANRPSCKVHPSDEKGKQEIADILEGRIRAIEAESSADAVYDTGAQQTVDGSFGAWRVITDYIDEESFNQAPRIIAIENPFNVIWDHMAQKWDKSDAEWVAVLSKIHKDTYKERYKGRIASSFEVKQAGLNWYLQDNYTLCEYFRRENAGTKTLYMLPMEDAELPEDVTSQWAEFKGKVDDASGKPLYESGAVLEELPSELKEIWPKLVKAKKGAAKERTVARRKIVRYLLSGHEILEDKQEWISERYWPIVPVEGKTTNIDGKVYKSSVNRNSKDAQKAYNFAWNTALEEIAIVPKAPYLVTPDQIKGFQGMWDSAHKKTYPYLLYNRDPKNPTDGPPQRTHPAQASTAITEITMRAVDDMRSMSNVFDPGMQQMNPDVSGKAILARVSRAGVANFEFVDNVARSIALTWRILLDIIPKVEDTARLVRTRTMDGISKTVPVNVPNPKANMGQNEPPYLNDLTLGKYDVAVTIGPSYATQRMEAAENTLQLMKMLPRQLAVVLADFVVKNFDWHGAQEASDRIRLEMVKAGKGYLYKPEELQKLMQQIASSPPPPMPPMPPMLKFKMQQEQFKALKAMFMAIQTQGKIDQMKEEHFIEMIRKLEEVGQQVLMREQGTMGQPPGQGQQPMATQP